MDDKGTWSLAPAYDMTYAYDPDGLWTLQHKMSINGKRDGFLAEDFRAVAGNMNIKNASSIVEQITDVVRKWPLYAEEAGVPKEMMARIKQTHRTLPG